MDDPFDNCTSLPFTDRDTISFLEHLESQEVLPNGITIDTSVEMQQMLQDCPMPLTHLDHGVMQPGLWHSAENIFGAGPGTSSCMVQDASLCNNLICQSTSTTPPVTPPPIGSNCYGVFLPTTISFPGAYDFSLSFPNSSSSKAAPWTFSPLLKKLYCQLGKPCPLQISVTAKPPPDCYVRAMAIFKQKEHAPVPVTRCPNHYQNHEGKKDIPPDHLICVEGMDKVFYVQHPASNRHSVFVPFCLPQVGCEYTTLMCSFMCNTSCNGGMNRRPIHLLLTLENSNWDVIGRCCIEVRICASPGRDRSSDEARLRSVHPEKEDRNVKNENSVAQSWRKTTKRGLEQTSECKEFAKVEHKMRINEGDLMQNRREGKNPTFSPLHDIVEPVLNGNVQTNSPSPENGYCLQQVQDEETYKIMKTIALALEVAKKLPRDAVKQHLLGHELTFHLSTPSSFKKLCTIQPKGLLCNGGEASNRILTCTLWPPSNTYMDGSLASLLKKIGCADCIHFFTSKNLTRTCQLREYNREDLADLGVPRVYRAAILQEVRVHLEARVQNNHDQNNSLPALDLSQSSGSTEIQSNDEVNDSDDIGEDQPDGKVNSSTHSRGKLKQGSDFSQVFVQSLQVKITHKISFPNSYSWPPPSLSRIPNRMNGKWNLE